MLFDVLDTVVDLMRRAKTQTGLRTTVNVIRRCYQAGRVATSEMKKALTIEYDSILPKWSYVARP